MSSTDTDLEPRLRATLRAKAEQVPEVSALFDPSVVTQAAGAPRRTRMPLLVAAAVFAVVVIAALGFFALRHDGDTDPTQVPAGQPEPHFVGRVVVESLPTLQYQAKEFTTAPGLNEIVFRNSGGTHDLVFADPAITATGFHLTSSSGGEAVAEVRGSVELQAGKDYVISCSIPGHRLAGEVAVIHVTG